MAKYVVPRRLEVSTEQAVAAFREAFGDKYEVYPTKLVGSDLIIKKSGWSGVAVKIKPKDDQTLVKYFGMAPSAGVRMLALGVIPILILRAKSWKAMEQEVRGVLESSPLFQ